MRDDDQRVAAAQPFDGRNHRPLRRRVQRRRRFIEHKQLRIAVQRAGDRHALTLSAGQTDAALSQNRPFAFWKRRQKLVQLRCFDRLLQRFFIDVRIVFAQRDVRANRVVQKIDVLRHIADVALPCGHAVRHVAAVHQNAPFPRRQQPKKHVDKRRLARTGRSDNAQRHAFLHRQAHVMQRLFRRVFVTERQAIDADVLFERNVRHGFVILPRHVFQKPQVFANRRKDALCAAHGTDIEHEIRQTPLQTGQTARDQRHRRRDAFRVAVMHHEHDAHRP